jgi:sec-independent protein translocase protein TatA
LTGYHAYNDKKDCQSEIIHKGVFIIYIDRLSGMGYENVVIIAIAAIALLFGAKKLPEFARSLGRARSEFEKAKMEFTQETGGSNEIEKRRKLEDIASKLEIENTGSLSDEELHRKILESIKSNRDVVK